jgi:NAD(P)-dependent dehydrogenase (short-subunit alcohol dehydrogenase family)
MDLGLTGKRALVTGGSRGVGRSIVERLAAEGMQVAICARGKEGIDETIETLGPQVVGAAVDASDHRALEQWALAMAEQMGGIDVVIPNASALGGIPKTPEGWRRNFEVDLMSSVTLIDAALPFLRDSHGSIVQIGTITAVEYHHYPGGGLSYGPLKAALINYIAQLAKEEAVYGVRANAVSPGPIYIKGGSWDKIRQKKPDYFEVNLKRQPFGRFGYPAEVADVVAFMSSDCASWVTGQNIVVDGGFTQRIGY